MVEEKTLEEYIKRHEVDGIMWKARKLLGCIPHTDIRRNENVLSISNTLAATPYPIVRDDYIKKIAEEFSINCNTLQQLVNDTISGTSHEEQAKPILRNEPIKELEIDPTTFQFFNEKFTTKKGEKIFDGLKIDKVKFLQLLAHFGFARLDTDALLDDDKPTFVRITDNVLKTYSKNKIIDFILDFLKTDFRYEEAGYSHVNADVLFNHFFDRIQSSFSRELFARLGTKQIVFNTDTKNSTYLYFKNGFVEITREGYRLRSYDEMKGSIWEHQMLSRNFEAMELAIDADNNHPIGSTPDTNGIAKNLMKAGYFADFCWKISGSDLSRFKSLCSIIGYIIHDYYEYDKKALILTDSTLSDESNGRSGKTLLAKMVGLVRSYCEINGKDFDSGAEKKYQSAQLGTQVIHINDIKHTGKSKFNFEDLFNDITEGYSVRKLYQPPFKQFSKMIISSNRTIDIQGDSQKDRCIEYELSDFFNARNKPEKYYGQWFGTDWDEIEFKKFDNFMCCCSQLFHSSGIINPVNLNLEERKLIHHTSPEFLQFMDDIKENLKTIGTPWTGYLEKGNVGLKSTYELQEFELDKRRLYERFISENPEMKLLCSSRKFYSWLKLFARARFGLEKLPERRSNGASLIKFS